MQKDENKFYYIANRVTTDFLDNKKVLNTDMLKYLKEYIFTFPNEQEVLKFKEWINNLIYKNLFKQKFTEHLYSNDSFYFYRLLEMFANRPFLGKMYRTNEYSFISKLTEPEFSDYCGNYQIQLYKCVDYFKRIGVSELTDEYEKRVLQFIEDDYNLIIGEKDIYTKSLDDEILKYNKYLNLSKYSLYNLPEFKLYQERYSGLYIDDVESKFFNKLLGNIGEYLFLKKYSNEQFLKFVARDIGNGLGYDIYFRKGNIEKLIEVKTTSYYEFSDKNDSFYISKNEYDRMLQVFNSNFQALYSISRIFYKSKTNYDDIFLEYVGNDTLRCQSDHSIEYGISCDKDNKIFAKRKK